MSTEKPASSALVKKLLFPSYADSGASETYVGQDTPSVEQGDKDVAEDLIIRKAPSTASSQVSNDSTVSTTAPTEVQNNLTNKTNAASVLQSTPGLPRPTDRTNSYPPPPKSDPRSRQAPSFFSTTRPAVTKSASTGGDAVRYNEGRTLESPPKLPRRPMPSERSSSTVALTGGPSLFSSDSSAPDTSDDGEETDSQEGDDTRPTTNWEEEATPAQTAFGKELLFRRKASPSTSEVMSTASEMGTVIGPSQLADLDREVEAAAIAVENGELYPLGTPTASHQGDIRFVTHMPTDEGLALPLLETKGEEKKSSDDMGNKIALAIRRMGSGLGGTSKRTSVSAPSTPRRSASYGMESHSPVSSTPSSFLLRSPGSSAHFAANSRKRFLSPRQRYERERRNIERIPENEALNSKKTKPSFPLQIARSCFSFDALDTSADRHVEYNMSPEVALNLDYGRYRLEKPQLPLRPQDRYLGRGSNTARTSSSWDIPSQSMFRPTGFLRPNGNGDAANTLLRSKSLDTKGTQRTHFASNLSPTKADPNSSVQLSSPQRLKRFDQQPQQVEIEREDAIDILACLVEKGLEFKISDDDDEQFIKLVDKLKEEEAPQNWPNDTTREDFLDEVVKSHQFALEMKRASQSASTWLKSIGRKLPQAGLEAEEGDEGDSSMDLATTRARLHEAETRLQDKIELSARLDEELAKCRAEIGRLRSNTSNSNSFRSPNRSILDQSDDISAAENEELIGEDDHVDKTDAYLNNSLFPGSEGSNLSGNQASELHRYKVALEEANQRIEVLFADLKTDSKDEGEMEDEAPIVKVESPVRSPKNPQSPGNTEEQVVNVRMLDGENFMTDWDDLTPPLPPPPDHGLRSPIVATVLEEWSDDSALHESLITWMDSVLAGMDPASIPPLTISSLDHQVRDAFTMHVLPLLLRRPDIRVDVKSRAQRRTLYDLAVAVEGIVPERTPVQLDRFRHLETTAAHSDVGGVSSVQSSATTALMANTGRQTPLTSAFGFNTGTPGSAQSTEPREYTTSRLSYDEMSENINSHQNAGLMSTLGGALGGLLTRRKTTTGQLSSTPSGDASSESMGSPTHPGTENSGTLEEDLEEVEPYHRVVSAPPGRIGVTFVEYRGHAMVSDVAPDSPLQGWIYASDVLIAIDEIAVSGMRIREIIQILKDRNSSQRALRVISIHTMSDAVLSTSSVTETGSEVIQ